MWLKASLPRPPLLEGENGGISVSLWTRLSLVTVAAALIAAACVGGSGGSGGDTSDDGLTFDDLGLEDRIPSVAADWNTDWSNRTISLSELVVGIQRPDPRDVIPPIDDPQFETVEEATEWLADREPVVLLELEGEARAYPLRIIISHEVVNDQVGSRSVVVSYCPLCNSAVTFDRELDGQVLRFGVSGLLRNSDLVMWDQQTESLWQQITGEGIVGELAGTTLDFVSSPLVSWEDFRTKYPDGKVLSREQGIYPPQVYDSQPYAGYDSSRQPFLFRGEPDDRYPAMERVVAMRINGANKAYPFSVISEERAVNDEVDGTPVLVVFGAEDTASVLDTGDVSTGRAVGVGLAYERTVDDRVLTFDPEGEDRFVDRETGSVWDLFGSAVEGPLTGEQLTPVVNTNELWFAWAAFNSDAPVYTGSSTASPSDFGY